jgi:hypothetical protein
MGHLEFCKYAILFECHHSKRCIDKKCRSTISHFAEAKWHIRRIRLREMHLPFASAKWQSLWRMHRIRQSVVIPSGVMLNVVVTSVVAPSVVMLNVVVPFAILLQRMARPMHLPVANDRRMRCLAISLPMANGECKVSLYRVSYYRISLYQVASC